MLKCKRFGSVIFVFLFNIIAFYCQDNVIISNTVNCKGIRKYYIERDKIIYEVEKLEEYIVFRTPAKNEFPQCKESFSEIMNSLDYPEKAKPNKINGVITVKFVVAKDGTVHCSNVFSGIRRDFNNEALRLLNLLSFEPAYFNGQPVHCTSLIKFFFEYPTKKKDKKINLFREFNMNEKYTVERHLSDSIEYRQYNIEICLAENIKDPKLIESDKQIRKLIQYPDIDIYSFIEGAVIVGFVITEQGQIKYPKIFSGIRDDFDKEAMRVLQLLHTTPAKHKGTPVDSYFYINIDFRLKDHFVFEKGVLIGRK